MDADLADRPAQGGLSVEHDKNVRRGGAVVRRGRTDPIARIAFHRLQDSKACWDFGGNPALAKAFLALLINPDSGTLRVFHHYKASPHAFRTVALRWIDDGLFHLLLFRLRGWQSL